MHFSVDFITWIQILGNHGYHLFVIHLLSISFRIASLRSPFYPSWNVFYHASTICLSVLPIKLLSIYIKTDTYIKKIPLSLYTKSNWISWTRVTSLGIEKQWNRLCLQLTILHAREAAEETDKKKDHVFRYLIIFIRKIMFSDI